MARRVVLWAVAAMIIAVAVPAMAGPADWQAAATKAAALLGGTPAPAVDVAAALAAGPDDANYWLAVGVTVKSGADEDYWLPVLVNGQGADGSWGSALGTAGAVIGLAAANATAYASQIAAGANSLAAAQNADGSWVGDARDAYVLQALKAALASGGGGTEAYPVVTITTPLEGACLQPTVIFPITGTATDSGSDMNRTVVVFDSATVQDLTFANTGSKAVSATGTGVIAASPLGAVRAANVVTITTTAAHGLTGGSVVVASVVPVGTPIAASPGGAVRAANVVTITTNAAHNFVVGNSVVVRNVVAVGATNFNGTFTITTVPTAFTFTYAQTAAADTGGGGFCGMNFNGTFTIASVPTTTTFTYAQTGPNDTGGAGTWTYNMTAVADGAHSVSITAYDAGALWGVDLNNFQVDNTAPTLVTLGPLSPQATAYNAGQPYPALCIAADNQWREISWTRWFGLYGLNATAHDAGCGISSCSFRAQLVRTGFGMAPPGALLVTGLPKWSVFTSAPFSIPTVLLYANYAAVGNIYSSGNYGPGCTTMGYVTTGFELACPNAGFDYPYDYNTMLPQGNSAGFAGPTLAQTLVDMGAPRAIADSPTGAVRAGNVVTITTSAAHALLLGQAVTVEGVTAVGGTNFNGTFAVTAVPSGTTFTYAQAAANDTGGSGSCYGPGSQKLIAASPTGAVRGGPPIAIAASPTGAVRAANVVTITTSVAHGLVVSDGVIVAGVVPVGATNFNGTFTVASVPTATTFTYAQTAAADTGGGGACNVTRVTLTTTAPHNLVVGDAIRVQGVTSVGSSAIVTAVRAANVVTITTGAPHGLSRGGSVLVSGVVPVGTPIAASPGGAVRAANVVTITTTVAHGLTVGQTVLVSGVVPVGATVFNGTFAITAVPTATSFTYAQTAANDTGGGGSCGMNFNATFAITAVPTVTTFTYAQTGPNDTGAGGTCSTNFNNGSGNAATWAITLVPTPTTLCYTQLAANDTGGGGSCGSPGTNMAAGKYYYAIAFEGSENGVPKDNKVSTPSPIAGIVLPAASRVRIVNVETSPSTQCVTRRIYRSRDMAAHAGAGFAGLMTQVSALWENLGASTRAIASIVRTGGVVTVTTTTPHGVYGGNATIVIAGVTPTSFNGTFPTNGTVSATSFTYLQAGSNESGSGGTVASTSPNYTDTIANRNVGWTGGPAPAPYVDIDADLTPIGIPDMTNCASGPCDATMRGIVLSQSCSNYNTLKLLSRFWPSRGRYGPIALAVRATDFAGKTLDTATTNVTIVCPIFQDVQMTDWAWDDVERIRDAGITVGTGAWPDTSFPLKRLYTPDGSVTRRDQVVFIIRAMGIDLTSYTPPGTSIWLDVTTGDSAYKQICKAFDLGITQGCYYNPGTGQRKFCPNNRVTRAEMVTFLLRSLGQGADTAAPQEFGDVPPSHWAYGMMQRGYRWDAPGDGSRVLEGCKIVGGTKYACPDENVQRRQMAVFLCRAYVVPAVRVGPSNPW